MSTDSVPNVLQGEEPAIQWRKVHPLTPLTQTWGAFVAVVAFIIYQLDNFGDIKGLSQMVNYTGWGMVLLIGTVVLLALLLVLALFAWLSWRFTQYAVTDESVLFRKGVIFKTERHMRLNRVQAVDVIAPLVPRLFGLAKLHIDSAGDGDSKIDIAFLSAAQCQDLRSEVLAKAAGLKRQESVSTGTIAAGDSIAAAGSLAEGGSRSEDPATGAGAKARGAGAVKGFVSGIGRAGAVGDLPVGFGQAPEVQLYKIPTTMLIESLLRSISNWVMLAIIPIVIVGTLMPAILMVIEGEVTSFWAGIWAVPQTLIVAGGTIFGLGTGIFAQINRVWDFTAAISPDGIRLRHGLTTHDSQTIPPGRVHAVVLRQPFLWRKKDWWKVEMTLAGYQGASGDSGGNTQSNILLPVGTRQQALHALWMMERDLGAVTDAHGNEIGTAGTELLDTLMYGSGPAEGLFPASPRSKWLDWITWKRNAAVLTSTMVMIRSGRITRSVSFVPHARVQSVAVMQGPLQRKLDVASVHLHLVPGLVPTSIDHQEPATALQLWKLQVSRSDIARDKEGPEEWMRRVTSEMVDSVSDGTESTASAIHSVTNGTEN